MSLCTKFGLNQIKMSRLKKVINIMLASGLTPGVAMQKNINSLMIMAVTKWRVCCSSIHTSAEWIEWNSVCKSYIRTLNISCVYLYSQGFMLGLPSCTMHERVWKETISLLCIAMAEPIDINFCFLVLPTKIAYYLEEQSASNWGIFKFSCKILVRSESQVQSGHSLAASFLASWLTTVSLDLNFF